LGPRGRARGGPRRRHYGSRESRHGHSPTPHPHWWRPEVGRALEPRLLALLAAHRDDGGEYREGVAHTHMTPDITPAGPADLPAILELLTASKLPRAGIEDHLASTLLARVDSGVVGTAARELYGSAARRRSVAVGPTPPFLTRVGTRHHDVYVLGLRAERALVQHGALQLYHTVDALPLAVSTAMPVRYDDGTCAGAAPQDQATCLQWVPHFGT